MNTRRTLRKAIAGLLKQTVANPPSTATSVNHGNTEYTTEPTEDKNKK